MRVRYYYDKLGRLHHRSIGVEGQTALLAGTEYYYQDNPDGSTTPLISKVDSHGWVTEYTNDDNGNITEARETRNGVVKVTGYEYDAIGQLIRVIMIKRDRGVDYKDDLALAEAVLEKAEKKNSNHLSYLYCKWHDIPSCDW